MQISAVYGNAMKDRLYCELPNSPLRRRCQTVMYKMASSLTRLLAPMLVFTADEVWEKIPHRSGVDACVPSVHMTDLPTKCGPEPSDADQTAWDLLTRARDQATAQLDALKKSVGLNKALDAELIYHVDDATRAKLEPFGPDLEDVVGAGFHSFQAEPPSQFRVEVVDRRQMYKSCARSWKRRPDVGSDSQYPDLSVRDAAVVRRLNEKKN